MVFRNNRLAIFVDGDFWHGYKFKARGQRLSPYWRMRIEKNIRRDKMTNRKLGKQGWMVMRFWEYEINRSPSMCASKILRYLKTAESR